MGEEMQDLKAQRERPQPTASEEWGNNKKLNLGSVSSQMLWG